MLPAVVVRQHAAATLKRPVVALCCGTHHHHSHRQHTTQQLPRWYNSTTSTAATDTNGISRPPRVRVCVVGSGPGGFYAVEALLRLMGSPVAAAGHEEDADTDSDSAGDVVQRRGQAKRPQQEQILQKEGAVDDPAKQPAAVDVDVDVDVDVYERQAVPYGLVRFGVAPDHPEVKAVQRRYDAFMADPRLRFIGNVTIGQQQQATPPSPVAQEPQSPSPLTTTLQQPTLSVADLLESYHAVVLAAGAQRDRPLGVPGEDLPAIYSARTCRSNNLKRTKSSLCSHIAMMKRQMLARQLH